MAKMTTKGQRIYLNYFLTGLLPKLRSQVESLMPQRLDDALALANSFENKNLAVETKKNKKHDDSMEKLNEIYATNDMKSLEKSFLTMSDNLEKKIFDKFNLLSERIGRLIKDNQNQQETKYGNTQNSVRYDNDCSTHGRRNKQ